MLAAHDEDEGGVDDRLDGECFSEDVEPCKPSEEVRERLEDDIGRRGLAIGLEGIGDALAPEPTEAPLSLSVIGFVF